jgi:hypothetical protein
MFFFAKPQAVLFVNSAISIQQSAFSFILHPSAFIHPSIPSPYFPIHSIQPGTPDFVLRIIEFHCKQRIVLGASGAANQFHPGFVGGSPTFLDVAAQTRANHVLPRGFTPAAARYDVIQAQLMRGIVPAAVLTRMFIPRQYVTPIKMQMLLRQAIEPQQPDHPRHLNLKSNRANPIFVGLFIIGAQFAYFLPGLEGIIGKLAFLQMNYFGHLAVQQAESTANIYNMHCHIKAIENQNTGV